MVIGMFTKLESGKGELRDNFNKEWEIILENKADLKNIITELKDTLEEINSRLTNTVQISNLGDRIVEMNQSEE